MKILMFGAGVINTLYAWAFSNNGHDVSLLVRPGREANWKDGLRLNIIDHRTGKDVAVNEVFAPRVVSQFSPTDNYDFIIESVKHTQTEGILPQIKQNAGNAIVVFFNNNWRGVDFIDEHFDKTKYVLAMPRAGGIIEKGALDGAIMDEIMLGDSLCGKSNFSPEVETVARQNMEKVKQLFESAGIKSVIQSNMEHWYWVHFASTAPWIAGGAKARGFQPFIKSLPRIREAIEAGKEVMEVCKARGVDVTKVQDAQVFLAPTWISTLISFFMLQSKTSLKISGGHGRYAPEELQQIYYDVLETGQQYHIAMPKLLAFKPYIDEMINARDMH